MPAVTVDQPSGTAQKPAPVISVIIATYNYGRYLKRSIDSVLDQDFDGFELILVDDGSCDDTRAIAEQYGDRIRYIHQEHSGTFIACRTGIRHAKCHYVVFVDADDRLRPGALRRLYEAAIGNPSAKMILGRTCSIDAHPGRVVDHPGLELSQNPIENFARFCSGKLKAPIAGGLIHVSLLQPYDREPFDYPQSMDLVILGMGTLHGLIQIDDVTLDIFFHEGQLRNNINYIDKSGLTLVDVLFDPGKLTAEAMIYRPKFLNFLQRERARSFYRAGWYSASWRCYVQAVLASPMHLPGLRDLRRLVAGFLASLFHMDEGPVSRAHIPGYFRRQAQFYKNPIEFVVHAAKLYKGNIKIRLHPRTYLLMDADDIKHILTRNAFNYQPAGISRINPTIADSLLGTLHPQHEQGRRWLAPYFHPKRIGELAPIIQKSIDCNTVRFSADKTCDISPIIRSMNIEIAGRIILGCNSSETMSELDALITKSLAYSVRELKARFRPPNFFPMRRRRVIRKTQRKIIDIFSNLVNRDIREIPPSILREMLGDRRPTEPDAKTFRRNTMGLLLASYEPVSRTTIFALHVLGRNPILQNKIVQEIAAVNRDGAATNSVWDNLKQYVHLNNFIDEVYRLYPAECLLTRAAMENDRLPSGLLVRRGNHVVMSVFSLHRNTNYYADPEIFNPARFQDSSIRTSGYYIPFGAGPTGCLGPALARLIVSLSLLVIVSRWELVSLDETLGLDSPEYFSLAITTPVRLQFVERHRS